MSGYLDVLENDVYAAVRVLERERYYEYTPALIQLVEQAKHYQRITESLLASQTDLPYDANQREFNRANDHRDWFRFPEIESPQRPSAEIES